MQSLTLALKYAKALFDVAKEQGKIKEFGEELEKFLAFTESIPSAVQVLESPIYPPDLKQEILEDILKNVQLDPEVEKFLKFLVERRRMPILKAIVEMYRGLLDEELGIIRGEVVSVIELPEEEIKNLQEVLSEKFKKQVILRAKVNPEIIGGLLIKLGDLVCDATIKSQLKNLKEIIAKGVL